MFLVDAIVEVDIEKNQLTLRIDNSDVFWFMEQKDLCIPDNSEPRDNTLCKPEHLAYSESRARLHDLYGVLEEGHS